MVLPRRDRSFRVSHLLLFTGGYHLEPRTRNSRLHVQGGMLPAEFLIVKDAPYFLLSVSKLCDQGFTFSFYDTGGRIIDQDGNVFATMSRVGDLYHLDLLDKQRRSKPLDFSVSRFLKRDESHLSLFASNSNLASEVRSHQHRATDNWMHR